MKRSFSTLSLLLCVGMSALAQNYKSLSANVKYLKIPAIIQSAEINTYNVEVAGYEDDLNNLGYSSGFIADQLGLNSFSRVDGEGEIRIVFRFAGYGNLYGNMQSVTGSDGKVKYYQSYSYMLPMSYEIYSLGKRIAGQEILLSQNDGGNQYVFNSATFPSSSESSANWNGKGKQDLKNHIKGYFDKKFKVFVQSVKDDIDYQKVKSFTNFGYFKSNKKADYTDYERAAESAERALAPMESAQPRTGLRSRLDSAITFWKTKISALSPTDKEQDKLFFACANNLANAYYWVDDIDSAKFYIREAEKADVREGYLSMLKSSIERRDKDLRTLKAFNINAYLGPEAASYEEIKAINNKAKQDQIAREAEIAAKIAAEEKKLAPVIEEYKGYIINLEDKQVNGTFKCYKINNGDRTNRNYFIADGSAKEQELSSSFIKLCEFGSLKYEAIKYYDGLDKEKNLLEVLFESPKIKVYRFYTWTSDKRSVFTNILYKRPGDEFGTNSSNLLFTTAFKAKMAKYFEDCPALAAKIQAGDYPESDQMRIAAASDYSTLCK